MKTTVKDRELITPDVIERRKARFNSLKGECTMSKLAETLGIQRSVLYNFIMGNYGMASTTLYKMSKIINRPIEWILAFDDEVDLDATGVITKDYHTIDRRLAENGNRLAFRNEEGLMLARKIMTLSNSELKKATEYIDYLVFTRKEE